jgi:UDP-GlcNAc:undecaprenyl-phosphate GlcNAc-1-phosphate transferase
MDSMIFLAVASFALSLVLTPLVRDLALRLDLVDEPDHNRKIHKVPIPRIGGVAVVAASVGAYTLLPIVRLGDGMTAGVGSVNSLLLPVFVIFCVGLVDDIFEIRAWYKLSAQVFAAILAWSGGIHLSEIAGHELPKIISLLLTVLWIVACTNAINLIDGVDGLAGGAALFATATMLIAALLHHNVSLALATIPLAGALLGFLRFNFSPASIFLGDCGSLTLGFLLGCYGIFWAEKSTTWLGMAAPLMVLSVPLLDVSLAILRRSVRQQPIFKADREHIHHKLLSQGLPPWRVALILYGFCGLASIAGLTLTATQLPYRGLVVIIAFVVAWVGIQRLGYTELVFREKVATGGRIHQQTRTLLSVKRFEQELLESKTLEDAWHVLCKASSDFGFAGIEWRIDGEVRIRRAGSGRHTRLDFPGRGYIVLTRETKSTMAASSGALFADCVGRVFFDRLNELSPSGAAHAVYASMD